MNNLTLDKLAIGQTGIIQIVGGEGILRRRLLDMGLTPRTRVMVPSVLPWVTLWRYFCAVMS